MAKPFRLERELREAYERANMTVDTIHTAYVTCMRDVLQAIAPVILEVYADPRSERGDPTTHLYLTAPFLAHQDSLGNPVDFRMRFEEQRVGYADGCFSLSVVLKPSSRLEITLVRDMAHAQIRGCIWDARWFVQEVSNRTKREILFSTDWFHPGEIPDEARSFRVYPVSQKKVSSKTTVS